MGDIIPNWLVSNIMRLLWQNTGILMGVGSWGRGTKAPIQKCGEVDVVPPQFKDKNPLFFPSVKKGKKIAVSSLKIC